MTTSNKLPIFTFTFVAVITLFAIGCGGPPAPENASTASGAATCYISQRSTQRTPGFSRLDVVDAKGATKTLFVGDEGGLAGNTKVFAVASWCPHTKSFVRALSDAQVKSDLAMYNLVFVLESDEWPAVRSQLRAAAKAGGLPPGVTVDQALQRLKRKAGNGPLFDPEFLDSLPGPYYFLPDGQDVEGFPNVYSPSTRKFDQHAMYWVETKSARAMELYRQFEKGGAQ